MVRGTRVENKVQVRARLRSLRRAMSLSEVVLRSQLIGERFLNSPMIGDQGTFGLYAAIENEVRTEGIFQELRKFQKRVGYPLVTPKGIKFMEVQDLSEMKVGRWGILEPREGGRVFSLDDIELVAIPGIGFDEEGYRVGYGKGYYDKALKNFKGIKVGLAYEQQILKTIPREADDICCDWICTEQRLIQCESA